MKLRSTSANARSLHGGWRMKALRMLGLMVAAGYSLLAVSQPAKYTTTDKGAIKRYESGNSCMGLRNWACAESEFTKAAEADPRFIEPRIMLADIAERNGKHEVAMTRYREVMAIDPEFFPVARLHLADLEFLSGQYAEAQRNYEAYLKQEQEPQRKARARLGVRNCEFAARAIQQPVPFEPKNLGPNVNSADPEYYPCITADDGTLMFTRRVKAPEIPVYGMQEDFYVSRRDLEGNWKAAIPLPVVNTRAFNEGAGTLSPDGRFLIFTKCALEDGTYGGSLSGEGSCDLFISRRVGDRWGVPQNLGTPVNSSHWETQPSLASDGRTLYYIRGSVARDGIKSMDIWTTTMADDGTWSKPVKLGDQVNTPYQEESVQIHPDGHTLYFSSNGHPGFGGLDIFMSRKQDDGSWGPALNLGYPINTSADENSILVDAIGRLAYFASDRAGGEGDLDLYSFPLYEEARPLAVSYIRGKVFDAATQAPVEADVQLFDLRTGNLATGAYSDPKSGEFLVCLPAGRSYALNATADGYLFYSENYDVAEGDLKEPLSLDVPLGKLATGSTIALRNIFFNTASYELLPTSNAELDKLVKLMKANPTLRIELGGHTDNVGADAANLTLSQQRANAVRDHVVAQGVDGARITAKGYGETNPVATNDTEAGRALNRRTEVTVL
ncbi:MAG: tetratricopeptide repeat protein [Flavobacteriales bacterium]|nr:MAG: tetratricopeptide repeat protein [Flavobacteriales bacterium]